MVKKVSIENNDFLVNNLKGLLQEKFWLLDNRLQQKRMNTSYKILTNAEGRILAFLRGEELTISEIARRLAISRQAVHTVISSLVKKKLLQLEPIPGNARDKRISFTKAGEAMKKQAAIALHELEQEVEAAIGSRNLQLLKSLLKKEW